MKLLQAVRPRPDSIRWFERLALLGIAVDCIYYLTVNLADDAEIYGPALSVGIVAAVTIASLVLVMLAARRASRIALWIILVLTLSSIPLAIWNGVNGRIGDPVALFGLVSLVFYAAAAVFAFLPSSREWFGDRTVETPA